jgi:hypothetical protein
MMHRLKQAASLTAWVPAQHILGTIYTGPFGTRLLSATGFTASSGAAVMAAAHIAPKTAVLMLNMGGPSTPDETGVSLLSRACSISHFGGFSLLPDPSNLNGSLQVESSNLSGDETQLPLTFASLFACWLMVFCGGARLFAGPFLQRLFTDGDIIPLGGLRN